MCAIATLGRRPQRLLVLLERMSYAVATGSVRQRQAARHRPEPALSRLQDRADVPPGAPLGTVLGQAARRRAVPAPGADGRG